MLIVDDLGVSVTVDDEWGGLAGEGPGGESGGRHEPGDRLSAGVNVVLELHRHCVVEQWGGVRGEVGREQELVLVEEDGHQESRINRDEKTR